LIKDRYPTVYVYLFLCGRHEKLKFEDVKLAKSTKKETIIDKIEEIILFMAKMKNIYEKDIFYDGHDRFLKLLYFIEIEK